jgi:hypothetical protein
MVIVEKDAIIRIICGFFEVNVNTCGKSTVTGELKASV